MRETLGRTVVLLPILCLVAWKFEFPGPIEPARGRIGDHLFALLFNQLYPLVNNVVLPLLPALLVVDSIERKIGHRRRWQAPSLWGRIFMRPLERRNQLAAERRANVEALEKNA